jgi:hypothetical protein
MRKSLKIAAAIVFGPIIALDLFAVTNMVASNYVDAWFPIPKKIDTSLHQAKVSLCDNGTAIATCTKT